MNDLKFCRICLNTESCLYHGRRFDLISYYEDFINVTESCRQIPYFFCTDCSTLLIKASKFREKCETSNQAISYMLSKGTLTQALIANINRKKLNLESPLSIIPPLVINCPSEIENIDILDTAQNTFETSVKQESETLCHVPIEHNLYFEDADENEAYKNENDDDFHVDDHNEKHVDLGEKPQQETSSNRISNQTDENNFKIPKRCKRKEKIEFATQKACSRANINRKKSEWPLLQITPLVINFPSEIETVDILDSAQNTFEVSDKQESKTLDPLPVPLEHNVCLEDANDTYINENNDDFHVDDPNEKHVHLDDRPKSKTSNNKIKRDKNNVKKRKLKEKVKFAVQKAYGRPPDPLKWKVVRYTEDEMIEEFNKRKDIEKTEHHCKYCIKNFLKEDTLKRHMKVHSKTIGKFVCFLCKRRFKWETRLRIHMKTHQLKYHCLQCFEVFNNRWVVSQHERMHEGITYECKHCAAKFMKISTYYSHLREHHRSEHICQICGESFVSGMGLRLHLIKTHNVNPKEQPKEVEGEKDKNKETYCEKCDISFQTKHAFDEHLNNSAMHVGDCELVIELNAKPSLLRQSTGPVKLDKDKSCPQCGQKFFTSKSYERHMSMKHEGGIKYKNKKTGTPRRKCDKTNDKIRYICEICGANLAAASRRVHQQMHQNIRHKSNKKFPCETCGKVFTSGWNRNQHVATHTGEKAYSCKLCDKKFTQQQGALKHFRRCH